MRQRLIPCALLCTSLLLAGSAAAQEVIHALSGTVVKTDAQARNMLVKTNDGSDGQFKFEPNPNVSVIFDKTVREHATPVADFDKQNADVVVFYYGNGDVRTVVAVQNLGAGPFVKAQGTVTKFNKHEHAITIKGADGKMQTFHMDPKAVADTMDGVVQADRFEPQKGDTVRVIATQSGGAENALFVRED